MLLTQQTWENLLFFGLWACFWVCLCDMALISEAISHKLTQKWVIVYSLDYLGHLVNPGAVALASVVEQDWWLVFAFHHICLCRSSYLCTKLVTWNLCLDFSGLVEHAGWLPNQIGHGRDVYSLDQDEPWADAWVYLVELGLWLCSYSHTKYAKAGALFLENVHDCPWDFFSCARLPFWLC